MQVTKYDSFTSEMRHATRKMHSLSDALVNAKLVLALSDESVWADALLIFYEIFEYLERVREELPEMNALYVDTALIRFPAFIADLNRLLGAGWQETYKRRPEVAEYLAHLKELREERPRLLLAYVYHLYMGMLSGGQIIRAKRHIQSYSITSFFLNPSGLNTDIEINDLVTDFDGVNIRAVKSNMKETMNTIAASWTCEQRLALINESQMVFSYNNLIIKTVSGVAKSILWKVFYLAVGIKIAVILYYYFR